MVDIGLLEPEPGLDVELAGLEPIGAEQSVDRLVVVEAVGQRRHRQQRCRSGAAIAGKLELVCVSKSP